MGTTGAGRSDCARAQAPPLVVQPLGCPSDGGLPSSPSPGGEGRPSSVAALRRMEGEGGLPNPHNQRTVVGVGVMTYYNKQDIAELGENHYHDYIEKLARCVAWLLEHNYDVRLFIGDLSYDRQVIHDLKDLLKQRATQYEAGQLLDEPAASVEKLFEQLATTDMVVASRFHNIVFALMLDKPVLSISYHHKDDALMAEVGLSEYCQDIDQLDIDRLIAQLSKLDKNAQSFAPQISEKTDAYRRALDEQYAHIFKTL